MDINRAINVQRNTEMSLDSLTSMAVTFGMLSSDINIRYREIMDGMPKGTPRWVRSYCEGYFRAISKRWYNNELEFCYIVDGIKLSVRRDSDMYYEKHGITPHQLCDCGYEGAHYWIKTGKLFF